jgi:hypothetical protein
MLKRAFAFPRVERQRLLVRGFQRRLEQNTSRFPGTRLTTTNRPYNTRDNPPCVKRGRSGLVVCGPYLPFGRRAASEIDTIKIV